MKVFSDWMGQHPTAVKYGVAILLFVITLILVKFAQRLLYRFFYRSTQDNAIDPPGFQLIKNIISFGLFFIYVLVILHVLPGLEKLGTTLLASAGVITVVVGLATQQAFTNIISGLFLIIYKPFRVGDDVWFSEALKGSVEKLTLRHVVLRNEENKRIFIPNSVASAQAVINASITDEKVRLTFIIKITAQSDVRLAIQLVQGIAREHPSFIDPRSKWEKEGSESPVVVQVTDISGHVVQIKVFVWCRLSSLADTMLSDLLLAIREKFEQQSIGIT